MKRKTIEESIIQAQIGTKEQYDIVQSHMGDYFKRFPRYKKKLSELEWYHLFLDFSDSTSQSARNKELEDGRLYLKVTTMMNCDKMSLESI